MADLPAALRIRSDADRFHKELCVWIGDLGGFLQENSHAERALGKGLNRGRQGLEWFSFDPPTNQ